MPANAGLCGAVGRSTLLASRLLILRLTSRNPHGTGTSSPSASVSKSAAAPLAREGGGGVGIWKRAGSAGEFASRSNTYAGTGTIRYRWEEEGCPDLPSARVMSTRPHCAHLVGDVVDPLDLAHSASVVPRLGIPWARDNG